MRKPRYNQDIVLEENKICSTSGNILFYFYGSLPNFLDAAVVNVDIGKNKEVNYGAQCLFGAVGVGIASYIAGRLLIIITIQHYHVILLYFLFIYHLCYYLYQLEIFYSIKLKEKYRERKENAYRLLLMSSRMDNFMILLLVFVMGTAEGILLEFLFMLIKEEMKVKKSFIWEFVRCLLVFRMW